jgi:hypothetical protein
LLEELREKQSIAFICRRISSVCPNASSQRAKNFAFFNPVAREFPARIVNIFYQKRAGGHRIVWQIQVVGALALGSSCLR